LSAVIYDCFTFSDELELLELRLSLLEDAVDRFVLCEAPFTFRGERKPLRYAQEAARFARWASKIVHLVYPGPPGADPWENEWAQRDYLARGLSACDGGDLVLLGDCDEIPAPENAGRRPRPGGLLAHKQRHGIGYVNRLSRAPWFGTRAVAYGDLPRFGGLSAMRRIPTVGLEIVEGGWHFSSFGGPEVMLAKMKSYSHSEFDIPYYADLGRLRVKYASEVEGVWAPLDGSYPPALREPRWAAYVWAGPTVAQADTAPLEHAHGCFAYVPPGASPVVAVTADPQRFERAGRERFGPAFGGAVARLEDVAPDAGCIVVDGLGAQDPQEFARALRSGAAVVAYAANARSFRILEDVLAGGPWPAGPPLGATELRERTAGAARVDRIQTGGVFAPWSKMPEMLYEVALGEYLRFDRVARARLEDFLCHGFVYVFGRRGSASA
jgi:beta-1,4-mannosyl-glycoprotein beta-1,4-N-acetylglucosaminyltransferase